MGKQPCMLPSERLSITVRRHQASKEYMSMPRGPLSATCWPPPHPPWYQRDLGTCLHWRNMEREGRGKVPYWEMAPSRVSRQPDCPAHSWKETAEQVEQQSTESHLCQPFPLHLGHILGLSLRSIHFISKQKDHSSILDTFLQKQQSKAP